MDVPLETGSRGSVPLCISQDESNERSCPCNAVSCFCVHFFFEKKLYLYTSLKSWLKRSCFTLLVKLRADLIHALEIMQSRYSYDCKFVRVFPVCVSVLSIIVKSIVALAYCAALYLKG